MVRKPTQREMVPGAAIHPDFPSTDLLKSGSFCAGYRYDFSILQIELSLTNLLDRPVSDRIFFEKVIRENLNIGGPKQVQLILTDG